MSRLHIESYLKGCKATESRYKWLMKWDIITFKTAERQRGEEQRRHSELARKCCRDGLKIDYFLVNNPRETDRICSQHPDEGAKNRAMAWVKAALFQIDNGSTTDELRKFYLKGGE